MEYIITLMPSMLKGWTVTLQLFFIVLIFALPLGVVMGIARLSHFKPLAWFMELYVWLFRGTPLLLQLLFWYFGLMVIGLRVERETAVYLAFVLNYAAYLAEIFRSGIQSIEKGQYEAADVLGLSQRQTMTKIILPQVFKRVIPPVGNEVINLVKDTALVYVIAISELSRAARIHAVRDDTLIPFAIAALFYLLMTAVVQQFFKWLESRLDYYR
ncbi:Amino acid ABC transporter, permease protein, 3-TM domain, His/Glu/Gln/Arg/opine family [Syntrophomonas zehnderi OL-4]|uniref:Amino acid ABC transporter, permease protein, 3-TM domain, His/Glu/Gln/Arg/opine family n=1 Tax=Syntrophomonas zehnderi OL-4 TaxID=690567 RepID=A0A0E4GDS0_9FIRM|nr:amino acid ABC transporter permease [Syntrophomonas zehnderi]CFX57944.1 Amino acid ABC transporter, permease protein, 3-TM domain, His/Glu/Gln/Arg/opine family [Syntrophomonas zehnderi OL-4]